MRSCAVTESGVGDSTSPRITPSARNTTRSAAQAAVGVVGDHHDGLAQLAHAHPQERQHLGAGAGVQVAGRLVGEDHLRPAHQRPRAGHALLLAAGELAGPVLEPLAEVQDLDHLVPPLLRRLPAGQVQRQQDVLLGGQRGQQVEGLEDEADPAAAQQGQGLVVQLGQLHPADLHRAGRGGVQAGQAVHQRGLAGSGRAHDRGELPLAEADGDAVQRADGGGAGAVGLDEVAGQDRVAALGGRWASRNARVVADMENPSGKRGVGAAGCGVGAASCGCCWCGRAGLPGPRKR